MCDNEELHPENKKDEDIREIHAENGNGDIEEIHAENIEEPSRKRKRENMIRTLPCNHKFHSGCIDKWLQRSVRCPVCRMDVREPLGIKKQRIEEGLEEVEVEGEGEVGGLDPAEIGEVEMIEDIMGRALEEASNMLGALLGVPIMGEGMEEN